MTATYERAIAKAATPRERKAAEDAIIADPSKAPAIRGAGGIRKVRVAGSGRGKRGGLRVIYFHHVEEDEIYLLTAYAKAEREDLTSADRRAWAQMEVRLRGFAAGGLASGKPDRRTPSASLRRSDGEGDQEGRPAMTRKRTDIGREVESALGEVLAHVRGKVALPCRIVDDPSAKRIVSIRKRMKLSRQKFAVLFGLSARALQEWEQGRRVPDLAARVLLTVIEREPEAVTRALTAG